MTVRKCENCLKIILRSNVNIGPELRWATVGFNTAKWKYEKLWSFWVFLRSNVLWHLWAGAVLEYTDGDGRRHGQRFRYIQEDNLLPGDSRRAQLQLTVSIHHVSSAMVPVSVHLPSIVLHHSALFCSPTSTMLSWLLIYDASSVKIRCTAVLDGLAALSSYCVTTGG